jgi:hypothetical protein
MLIDQIVEALHTMIAIAEANNVDRPSDHTSAEIESAYRALTAYIAAREGDGWREIAEAPRDGTKFLATDISDSRRTWVVWYSDGEFICSQIDGRALHLTHFQPLPAPPAPPKESVHPATESEAQRGLNDTWPGDPYP